MRQRVLVSLRSGGWLLLLGILRVLLLTAIRSTIAELLARSLLLFHRPTHRRDRSMLRGPLRSRARDTHTVMLIVSRLPATSC